MKKPIFRTHLNMLTNDHWSALTVRNTAKGKLKGDYHFVKVYIWDKNINQIEQRLLVIRRTKSKEGTIEIKYSFTNANLEQYTRVTSLYAGSTFLF
jgi:hypothetical protein